MAELKNPQVRFQGDSETSDCEGFCLETPGRPQSQKFSVASISPTRDLEKNMLPVVKVQLALTWVIFIPLKLW